MTGADREVAATSHAAAEPGRRMGLSSLREAVANGKLHTVRVSFADRLGQWRGKRISAAAFAASSGTAVGFCDGMIVCDIQCDVIDATPFTNYDTGYPDMYVVPVPERLRPVGWATGEAYVFGTPCDANGQPLAVAPAAVLDRVLARLPGAAPALTFTLAGRLMAAPGRALDIADDLADPAGILPTALTGLDGSGLPVRGLAEGAEPGTFRLLLRPAAAAEAAEAVVVAKGALKELARQRGAYAVFMTLPAGTVQPSALEAALSGVPAADPAALTAALVDARALLQPSVNALRLGPVPRPVTGPPGPGGSLSDVRGIRAASEADPFTVAAVAVAAVSVSAAGSGPVTARAGSPSGTSVTAGTGVTAAIGDLGQLARQLTSSAWLSGWLGKEFLDNQMALLEREAERFRSSVTDWETARYWEAA